MVCYKGKTLYIYFPQSRKWRCTICESHQFCQYHFIKNAGNFMEKGYKELGKVMKKKELLGQVVSCIRPRLYLQDQQRHGAIHLGAQKKVENNGWLYTY